MQSTIIQDISKLENSDIISAKKTIEKEIENLKVLENSLDSSLTKVLNLMQNTQGRIVFTGMGKSGIIGRKIVYALFSLKERRWQSMSNGNWCYDVECYPNVFCCTFVNLDSDEKRIFVIGFRRDDRKELREFLSNEVKLLAGYNSIDYDGPTLRFARDYNGDNVNKKLLELSNKLVSRTADSDNTMFGLRYPKNRDEWKNVDLMKILAANKESDGGRAYVSLKQIAINLKWAHVQDLPYEPNSYIRPEDLETLLAYNLNDVLITKELYKKLEPLHEVRRSLGELYKLDFSSASNSKMGEKILEKYYAQEAGIKVRDIKDRRTERYNVRLGDCLPDYIRFSTPELKSLYERVARARTYL